MKNSGFIQVKDKSRIYFEEYGQGETLVLLHGNKGSIRDFDKQIPVLSKKFKIISFDYRDHGKSENKENFLNFELLVEDLKEILDNKNIKSTNILGFSDGANLALKFVLSYPDRVNKLILNSPNLKFSALKPLVQVLTIIENFIYNLLPFFRRLQRVSSLLFEDLNIKKEDLTKIDKPVLFIMGQYDLIRIDHIKRISRYIKNSKLVIVPKQGHHLLKKASKIFNTLVINFLGVRNEKVL